MQKNRIEYIDALKGLGIILVTIGHLNPWYPLERYIYSFHMGLFFFISGYLFKQKDSLKSFIIKKIQTVLVPFIFGDFLSSLISLASGKGLKSILVEFLVIHGSLSWNAPIWFLLVLFITEVIYASLMKANNSQIMKTLILIVNSALFLLSRDCNLTFKLDLLPFSLIFFSFGNLLSDKYSNKKAKNSSVILSVAVSGTLSVIFGAILNIRVTYTTHSFGNVFYFLISSFSGTLLFYSIFKYLIPNNIWYSNIGKFVQAAGKNSLIIMVTQFWFFRIFDYLSKKAFDYSIWNSTGTIKAIVLSVVIILIILSSVRLLNSVFKNNKSVLCFIRYLGIK